MSSASAGAIATARPWTLPKGTPESAETIEETALREVVEETGLEVRILAPVGAIDYFFTQDGDRIHKTVHFFLMEPIGGSLDNTITSSKQCASSSAAKLFRC